MSQAFRRFKNIFLCSSIRAVRVNHRGLASVLRCQCLYADVHEEACNLGYYILSGTKGSSSAMFTIRVISCSVKSCGIYQTIIRY